ncbi:MAG: BolA family transcriptional regulator [Parvularculaceae bacterium]|nr:BolA family transcriptional regulator [Parvularculaceae bacterium]
MGQIAERIETKLTQSFEPTELEIVDQSHLHAGHAGAPDGGESHFRVKIVSAKFEGQNRVARQRAVNAALKEELAGPVHALSIQALAPGEA